MEVVTSDPVLSRNPLAALPVSAHRYGPGRRYLRGRGRFLVCPVPASPRSAKVSPRSMAATASRCSAGQNRQRSILSSRCR
jgi:hypothetical protein